MAMQPTIGVFIKCGDKILGRNAGLGHNETLLKSALQCKHGALTDNAWSSLTSFAVVIAKRNAVLNDSHLMSDSKIGSNGGWHRELRTIIKSHVGLRTDHRRQWQLAAFKKVTNQLVGPKWRSTKLGPVSWQGRHIHLKCRCRTSKLQKMLQ